MYAPKVSVLMIAFNAEKYISEAIESILKQTYGNFEFIIIDDCSWDNTLNIIRKYCKIDKRIRLHQNKINMQIAKSRNIAINLAKGEYIAWQDSDDISIAQRLEKQSKYLDENKKVGIVGAFLEIFNEKKIIGVRKYPQNDEELRKIIFKYSPIAQPTAMIRRECFKKIGKYNVLYNYAEDLDMTFRIGSKYKLSNIQEILLKYRDNTESSTHKNLKELELNSIKIRKEYSKNYCYNMTTNDRLYNFFQFLSIFIIPAQWKITLFNILRNN